MADDIEFTSEEKKEFYNRIGSENFKLQSETLKEYGKQKIEIYLKSVGFTTTIISTIGIIAGFGFTAIANTESKILFFAGEGILIYSMFHGLVWVQGIYNSEFKSLNDTQERFNTYFTERNKLFLEIWNSILNTGKVNKEKILKLVEKNNEEIQLFSSNKSSDKKSEPNLIFSKKLYYLMIVGAIMLFVSFFIRKLLIFIFC